MGPIPSTPQGRMWFAASAGDAGEVVACIKEIESTDGPIPPKVMDRVVARLEAAAPARLERLKAESLTRAETAPTPPPTAEEVDAEAARLAEEVEGEEQLEGARDCSVDIRLAGGAFDITAEAAE